MANGNQTYIARIAHSSPYILVYSEYMYVKLKSKNNYYYQISTVAYLDIYIYIYICTHVTILYVKLWQNNLTHYYLYFVENITFS